MIGRAPKKRIGNKGKKLDLKSKREEHKVKEASNHEAEIEIQCKQHNQQIQMNMKMMEFLGSLTKKHKRHKEDLIKSTLKFT